MSYFKYINILKAYKLLNPRFLKKIKNNIKIIKKFDEDPILIVGCGRSGTTLLQAILGAHKDIFCFPFETNIFHEKRIFKNSKLNYYYNISKFYSLLLRQDLSPNARRWLEKTPKNVRDISNILKEFNQQIKIIHIIRDGRDVVTSKHPEHKGYYIPVERWVNDVKAGLEFQYNKNVFTIKYEDLIQKTEKTVKKTCNFLNIEYNSTLIDFHNFTPQKSHEAWKNGIQPLYNSSINKWILPEHELRSKEFFNHKESLLLLKELNYK